MRFAAIQMIAEFADIEANLKNVERIAKEAFNEGAEIVILPEFFTTAIGFHPKMLDAVNFIYGRPYKLLKKLVINYKGIIGGSFIAYRDGESYNSFILVFPDGSFFCHDKDQPTMWENCYYIGGSDNGIFNTTIGNIGAVLCWEFVRTRTVKRLKNKVDVVVGGSCWWTTSERETGFNIQSHKQNLNIMVQTPKTFAELLGVCVIHAAHAGEFEGISPNSEDIPYKSFYLGETQIVDGKGKILARLSREEGEGFIMEDIDLSKKWIPSHEIPEGFWIPKLTASHLEAWDVLNSHGVKYYNEVTKPYRKKKEFIN